jgi:NAD(P)-dependent dehydrogenase (short-subunit alcohol dehydrogenase family)
MATEQCHRTYNIMARAALGKYNGRLLLRSRMERPMDSNETDLRRRDKTRRWAGQPAELAPICVLLASPEASYVTGQVYAAVGGRREMS